MFLPALIRVIAGRLFGRLFCGLGWIRRLVRLLRRLFRRLRGLRRLGRLLRVVGGLFRRYGLRNDRAVVVGTAGDYLAAGQTGGGSAGASLAAIRGAGKSRKQG